MHFRCGPCTFQTHTGCMQFHSVHKIPCCIHKKILLYLLLMKLNREDICCTDLHLDRNSQRCMDTLSRQYNHCTKRQSSSDTCCMHRHSDHSTQRCRYTHSVQYSHCTKHQSSTGTHCTHFHLTHSNQICICTRLLQYSPAVQQSTTQQNQNRLCCH